MADNSDIRVLVGVEGGESIDAGSGQLIQDQLSKIAKKISDAKSVRISVHLKTDLQNELQKELDEISKGLKLKIDKSNITGVDFENGASKSAQKAGKTGGSKKTSTKNYSLANTKYALAQINKVERAFAKLTQDDTLKFNASDTVSAFEQIRAKYTEVKNAASKWKDESKQMTDQQKIGIEKLRSELTILIDQYKALQQHAKQAAKSTKVQKTDDQKGQEWKENQQAKVKPIIDAFEQHKDAPQYAAYQQQLAAYNAELDKVASNYGEVTSAQKTFVSQQVSGLKSLLGELQKYLQSQETAKAKAVDYVSKSNSELAKFNQYLTTINPRGLQEFASQIEMIRHLLKDGTVKSFEEATRAIRDLKAEMRNLGYEGGNILTYIEGKVKTFATYLISSKLTNVVMQALGGVKQNVIDLNDAMTDLRIVTGGTRSETEKLLKTYNKMAQQLGTTTKDVATGATDWLRQGYNEADSAELLKQSMTLSIVGDMESDEATNALTAALKGYQLQVEDASAVVDKFFTIDMKAATSASDLATALAKTAANAKLAGMSLDTVVSHLAVVNETMKEAGESTGTFYNTMLSRMAMIKSGRLEDPETGESLSDVETTLNGLGIKLRDTSGEFRNFEEVLNEVGGRWNKFSSTQQRAIATAFAGTRMQTRFITLMQGYEQAGKYAEAAANSAGVAAQKLGVYQESIEARSAKMAAAFEKLSQSMLDSELIGLMYDFGASILNLLSIGDGIPAEIGAWIAAINVINVGLKNFKAAHQGFSIGGIFKDLGWPKMTGDKIVPSYIEKAA